MGKEYVYSGSVHPGVEWTGPITKLKERINKDLGTDFNQCLLNNYRTGNDYISNHSDNERELSNGTVAGISLGAERILVMSKKIGK